MKLQYYCVLLLLLIALLAIIRILILSTACACYLTAGRSFLPRVAGRFSSCSSSNLLVSALSVRQKLWVE